MEHDLSFTDWINHIETAYFESKWIVLYERYKADDGQETKSVYSGLVKRKKVSEILENTSWDRMPTDGIYGITIGGYKARRTIHYYTYHETIVEPLVYVRDFEGYCPKIISVLEEIIVGFQLLVKEQGNKTVFIFIDENGREEEAIHIDNETVRINRKYLLEYMYVKRMNFVLYFELWRYSDSRLDVLGLTASNPKVWDNHARYDVYIDESNEFVRQGKSQGWVLGKRVYCLPRAYKSWYFNDEETPKEFEKFIIGVGKFGEHVCHTCEDDQLSDFFGKNPGSPHYLTPVFFSLDVMQKYYNSPSKYSVKDSRIEMISRWSLRIDNNHPSAIVSFLGDLGKIPYSEQKYWRSYNISPVTRSTGSDSDSESWEVDGRPRLDLLSKVAYQRGVLAEFTEPEAPELVLKRDLHKFYEQFYVQNGWHIIKPLNEVDHYRLEALHIPVDDSEIEFKNQIESMCVILIESINASQLVSMLGSKIENEKSISILERYLDRMHIDNEGVIEYLRNLNTLRNMKLHRNSISKPKPEQKRAIEYFSIETSSFPEVMRLILRNAHRLLLVLMKVSVKVDPEGHSLSQ